MVLRTLFLGLFLAPAGFAANTPVTGCGPGFAAVGEAPAPGRLFVGLDLEHSPLARKWRALLPRARERYPSLKFRDPSELHVTLAFVGAWRAGDLATVESIARVAPAASARLTPELSFLGAHREHLALYFAGAPTEWEKRVVAARVALVEKGLKAADPYDRDFKAHITLVTAPGADPSPALLRSLADCSRWIERELHPESLGTTIGPQSEIRSWVSGAGADPHGSKYRMAEDVLAERREGQGSR